jgi:hypothetical protein
MTMCYNERQLLADTIWEFMPRATSEEIREQRRYEIALRLFTQDVSTESELKYAKTVAARSAQFADALLDELEKAK